MQRGVSLSTQTWCEQSSNVLAGKRVAITGATGGLGQELCRGVLAMGGAVLLLHRSHAKANRLCCALREEFPKGQIQSLKLELTDMDSVRAVCEELKHRKLDVLVLNAGAYHLPRTICATGWDSVFQINFAAHYYMVKELMPTLAQRQGRVVAMGSIGFRLAKANPVDVDFAQCRKPIRVYGNSKRYLMVGLAELMRRNPEVAFVVAHPGISFTNIVSHYPQWVTALIRGPMKLIYMSPERAVRGALLAMTACVPYFHWIGPRVCSVWGKPAVRPIRGCDAAERRQIYAASEEIYRKLKEN